MTTEEAFEFEPMVSVSDLSRALGVHRRKIYLSIDEGVLECTDKGRAGGKGFTRAQVATAYGQEAADSVFRAIVWAMNWEFILKTQMMKHYSMSPTQVQEAADLWLSSLVSSETNSMQVVEKMAEAAFQTVAERSKVIRIEAEPIPEPEEIIPIDAIVLDEEEDW